MEKEFWQNKWEKSEIAFHEKEGNLLLIKYFSKLSLTEGNRIFIPLCGKTHDIHWLLLQGCKVVGAELSKIAIDQLFQDLKIEPNIVKIGNLFHYSAKNIDMYIGDIFDLSKEILGQIDAIYDRAAIVALPPDLRNRYTTHLMEITNKAKQLLICYEYDQNLTGGPPFSISKQEVKKHYDLQYDITLLEALDIALRGQTPANENIWMLEKKK